MSMACRISRGGWDSGGVTGENAAKPMTVILACMSTFVSVKPLDIFDKGPWHEWGTTWKCLRRPREMFEVTKPEGLDETPDPPNKKIVKFARMYVANIFSVNWVVGFIPIQNVWVICCLIGNFAKLNTFEETLVHSVSHSPLQKRIWVTNTVINTVEKVGRFSPHQCTSRTPSRLHNILCFLCFI